eukprot:CAMPEP_0182860872 /NCGR_PEP_ID=MMETSP0034_2-20130328/5175_1 /TAXON_ID=156128 /ORGANISM="Nephroselmis pyriformis, Strain CCMP717" /LENGTH=216 /DNA_ID=CAMNT_0024992737 /DNA_START=190 /DNA_END=841 /DNA_ORIENTATION=-
MGEMPQGGGVEAREGELRSGGGGMFAFPSHNSPQPPASSRKYLDLPAHLPLGADEPSIVPAVALPSLCEALPVEEDVLGPRVVLGRGGVLLLLLRLLLLALVLEAVGEEALLRGLCVHAPRLGVVEPVFADLQLVVGVVLEGAVHGHHGRQLLVLEDQGVRGLDGIGGPRERGTGPVGAIGWLLDGALGPCVAGDLADPHALVAYHAPNVLPLKRE